MSIAEMKEQIIKAVVTSEDQKFLTDVAEFVSGHQKSEGVEEVDTFYERLKAQYGEVLQKLAQ